MNPDDVVLVVRLNNLRDWELIGQEHWYRIPVRHAPPFFSVSPEYQGQVRKNI